MSRLIGIRQDKIYPLMGPSYESADFTPIDLSVANPLSQSFTDEANLKQYIDKVTKKNKARIGYGGYAEKRMLYEKSEHFTKNGQRRTIHLAIDIWVPEGHPIYCPFEGQIHSFAYNDQILDYGYTLILEHAIDDFRFFTLYGHLSSQYFDQWTRKRFVKAGEIIAETGSPKENGGWIPHLHFQVILDMEGKQGDYPGVCREADKEHYLQNCPDPSFLITQIRK